MLLVFIIYEAKIYNQISFFRSEDKLRYNNALVFLHVYPCAHAKQFDFIECFKNLTLFSSYL